MENCPHTCMFWSKIFKIVSCILRNLKNTLNSINLTIKVKIKILEVYYSHSHWPCRWRPLPIWAFGGGFGHPNELWPVGLLQLLSIVFFFFLKKKIIETIKYFLFFLLKKIKIINGCIILQNFDILLE